MIDQWYQKQRKSLKTNKVNGTYPANVGQAVQLLMYNLPYRQKAEVAITTESELSKLQY